MYDLAVIGAGPYGLSIASHAAAAGLRTRVLGRPMASWRDHMPRGMFLKSEPWSSNLSDPSGSHTLDAYCAARELRPSHGEPLAISTFTEYGMWFAERAAPPVEERTVTRVSPGRSGFRVETAEGERFSARTVALAVGVMPFLNIPEQLRGLPADRYSHSSSHRDLSRFSGKEVTVVGAGQAALETAALLAEHGARPRLVARAGQLNWNTPPQPLRRGLLRSLREPHSGLGTGWTSWVWSEIPAFVRHLPGDARAHIAATALGPAGAWWLRDRFEQQVPVELGQELLGATEVGDRIRLTLIAPGRAGIRTVETDHVIAATGFTPDLGRLELLDDRLRRSLGTVGRSRSPELNAGFESSYPGLFFAGLLAAPSFGPSMRFVYGATFTAGRLVRGVQRRLTSSRPLRWSRRSCGQGRN
ncbi:NAD(P)-binding domain-containing protein [Streptomyces sp. PSKA54]|uniref:NAD(P)-binding domain-containing protein n=1 Tax=Streptomyces himalayensis subsp. aureolus TaxID=2758039 RepID=A0A7W2HFP8_9ACTN|nr:NAD(P)-binding domain-containing protein [Streptomyces himalayensis]MBA4862198.1 NAD(P)-binding domain-containing protein [Streptomyces himalayensis subsp. aureolus]